jgi:hypothetical protein
MTSGGMLRKTVAACSVLAVAIAVAGTVTDHMQVGFGIGAGLLLGSLNGYLIQELLRRGMPFVASSLLRILTLTAIVLMAALLLGGNAWTVALGIGVAQLIMVAVSVRQGASAHDPR